MTFALILVHALFLVQIYLFGEIVYLTTTVGLNAFTFAALACLIMLMAYAQKELKTIRFHYREAMVLRAMSAALARKDYPAWADLVEKNQHLPAVRKNLEFMNVVKKHYSELSRRDE